MDDDVLFSAAGRSGGGTDGPAHVRGLGPLADPGQLRTHSQGHRNRFARKRVRGKLQHLGTSIIAAAPSLRECRFFVITLGAGKPIAAAARAIGWSANCFGSVGDSGDLRLSRTRSRVKDLLMSGLCLGVYCDVPLQLWPEVEPLLQLARRRHLPLVIRAPAGHVWNDARLGLLWTMAEMGWALLGLCQSVASL